MKTAARIVVSGYRTFCAGGAATISSTTTNNQVTSLIYLWHPSTVVRRYRLIECNVSWGAGVGGTAGFIILRRITAENGTPGGTALAAFQPNSLRPNASGATVIYGASGAPTRQAGNGAPDGIAVGFATAGSWTWTPPVDGEAYTCEPSTAEGWELSVTNGATGPTTAAGLLASMKWLEE